ncbi:MAG: alpha/beta fold hydrolase [Pseudomonadota bacterium]
MKALVSSGLRMWSVVFPSWAARWLLDQFMTPRPWRKPVTSFVGSHSEMADGSVLWRLGKGEKRALLVHGWSGHRDQFSSITKILLDRGFEVHLLDPPGHGDSPPQRSNPVRFIQAIEAVFGYLGRVDLAIGHSMGASALLHACLSKPRYAPSHLVSISAPANFEFPVRTAARMANLGDAATVQFMAMVEQEAGVPFAQLDLTTRATTGAPPLLLVHDENDPQIPVEHAEMIQSNWPKATVLLTKGFGHNRVLAAPTALDTIDQLLAE